MAGEIEVDESYFGGVRKGKRGRGAAGKVPVFGLLKRGGKVYAVTIPNARTETLLPIIESKIKPDSIVYTDSFRAYDVLDVSDFHHVRINHSKIFVEDRLVSLHVVYEAPMGALGIGSVATGAQGPHGLA